MVHEGTTAKTGADLLVESLIGHGIDTVFGVPGDTGINLYDVFARHQQTLRHILVRDERDSGYMADAYARTSRRLAVCEASSGAGAVYLASGLAESYASSVPVLVITTDIHRSSRGSGAVTEVDQVTLFSAVTKWQKVAENSEEIPALVAEAISVALTGRPGPTVLICPEDVLDEIADAAPSCGSSHIAAEGMVPADSSLERASELLQSAERPVMLAGGGVHMSGAWGEVRLLAERLGMPVATTIHGKSSFPEDHPLALGVSGGNGARQYAISWVSDADVVLIVGSRSNSTDTNGYTAPARDAAKVIQIDIDDARAGRNFPRSLGLVGDARSILRELRDRVNGVSPELFRARSQRIAAARAEWNRVFEEPVPELDDGMLEPRALVRKLHEAFGSQTWVTADPGTPTPNLSAFWEADGNRWRVVIPRGHGPMGYAISAAIGVSIAHPGERVLCLTTEGSLAMGIADWETAARLQLPITFVVLDNTSYAWIRMLQHLFMEQRYFQVDPGPIDPVLLAQGMGLSAFRVTEIADLTAVVCEETQRGGPFVIHVTVPLHQDSPPPVAPWQRALESPDAGRPVY